MTFRPVFVDRTQLELKALVGAIEEVALITWHEMKKEASAAERSVRR